MLCRNILENGERLNFLCAYHYPPSVSAQIDHVFAFQGGKGEGGFGLLQFVVVMLLWAANIDGYLAFLVARHKLTVKYCISYV